MEKILYSICMSCIHFDILKKDNEEYECECNKGNKIITAEEKKKNCPDYIKAQKLPSWYFEVSGFPEIEPFKKVFERRK